MFTGHVGHPVWHMHARICPLNFWLIQWPRVLVKHAWIIAIKYEIDPAPSLDICSSTKGAARNHVLWLNTRSLSLQSSKERGLLSTSAYKTRAHRCGLVCPAVVGDICRKDAVVGTVRAIGQRSRSTDREDCHGEHQHHPNLGRHLKICKSEQAGRQPERAHNRICGVKCQRGWSAGSVVSIKWWWWCWCYHGARSDLACVEGDLRNLVQSKCWCYCAAGDRATRTD